MTRSSKSSRLSRFKRTGRARLIALKAIGALAAIALVASALVGDQGLIATLRAKRRYDELARTIARERAENERLRAEALRLRNDPAAIEEIARRDLGLIRPGEKVFIIKDLPPAK